MYNTILIIISVLLNASAQLLMRKGMLKIGELANPITSFFVELPRMLPNIWLWLSMLCYTVSVILWLVVLSRVEVSYAYPFLSIGYIVVTVLGFILFQENVSVIRIAGVFVIIIGVILVSRS